MVYLTQHYLEILCALLFFISVFVGYFCIKFALIIINIQEEIEECINVIDEKYLKVTKILEIPLFLDSPEIKKLLVELNEVKMSILYIANKLALRDLRSEEEKNSND
jgi:hypothetical protein